MRHGLSKTALTQVLDAVLAYSASLDPSQTSPQSRVRRDRIARRAFGPHARSPVKLSELERVELTPARSRATPCLTADDLECILEAARELLHEQFRALKPANAPTPSAFEARLCDRFGTPGPRLTPAHFDLHRQLFVANTPAEFGFPDIMTWSDTDLIVDLKQMQRASLELLPMLRHAVLLERSDARKLRLVHVGISLAMLHHPGEPHHEHTLAMAHDVADAAGVLRLSHEQDDAIRLQALRMHTHLAWCSFSPHLRSPTNYLPLVTAGRQLKAGVWDKVCPFVENAVVWSRMQVRIAPTCAQVLREHASTVSFKARLLLALGGAGRAREAERLYAEATRNLNPFDMPFALMYPILRDVRRGHWRQAVHQADLAIDWYSRQADHRAAAAFAALRFHLTARGGSSPTAETSTLDLARQAVGSASVRYQFSHVFDIESVRTLLKRVPMPRRRGFRA